MKSTLRIVHTVIAVTTTITVLALDGPPEAIALEFKQRAQRVQKVRELMEKGKTDDVAVKEAIHLIPLIDFDVNPADYLTKLLQETEISPARVAKIVAGMVREKITAIEKDNPDSVPLDFYLVFSLFRVFPDYDILPIVKESLRSKDEHIRFYALGTYASRTGMKSIPLLREAMENKRLNDDYRNQLYSHLEEISLKLKKENKTADAEKFTTFLQEMKQAEQPKEKGEN